MKGKPTERELTEVIKRTDTDAVSISWVQRKFTLGYNNAKLVFQQMIDMGLINGEGMIKIDQYPRDEF